MAFLDRFKRAHRTMRNCGGGAAEKLSMSVTKTSIEINIKGRWLSVPALEVNGNKIILQRKGLKIAAVHDEEWAANELQDPQTYIQALTDGRRSFRADIFTFVQKLPTTLPKYSFPMEWESVAAVHLNSFREWWEGLPQEARKNVRRSQKRGVEVSVRPFDDALIRGIKDVNDDSRVRQRVQNAYYGKTLEETRRDYGAFLDRCDFICAHCGDEMIGFLKVVYRGAVASVLNLTTKPSHYDKRPSNALIAKMMELCELKHVSYVTYGLFNYGNKRNSPLREFKIRNGFGEVLVPRFYVPLTIWGKIAMKMKLHRGLLGIFPTRVITFAVEERARLYYIRQRLLSRCSSKLEQPKRNRQMERSNPPAGSTI